MAALPMVEVIEGASGGRLVDEGECMGEEQGLTHSDDIAADSVAEG